MQFLLEDSKDWNESFRPFATMKHHSFEECDLTGHFAHGTFSFVKKCMRMGAKAYANKDWFLWSKYAPYIGDNLMNRDYSILPAQELRRLKYEILGRHAIDCKIFIPPLIFCVTPLYN